MLKSFKPYFILLLATVTLVITGCGSSTGNQTENVSEKSGLSKVSTLPEIKIYIDGLSQKGRVIQAIPGLNQMKGPIFQKGKIALTPDPNALACKFMRTTGSRPSDDVISEGDQFKISWSGADLTSTPPFIGLSLEFDRGASGYKSYDLNCYSSNTSSLTGAEIVKAVANYLVIP